jgi:hypothetical protein
MVVAEAIGQKSRAWLESREQGVQTGPAQRQSLNSVTYGLTFLSISNAAW